ncbi:MAG: flavin reductase family protein [Candidatus Omnitrophota bacterium]|nr:flavin reductase family protein [Candidatus Omnitrophota bacterium]
MPKSDIPTGTGLFPIPVVLISCIEKDCERANIITIAWCGIICSEPPSVAASIRPSRHSYKMIKSTGDFVMNIPTKSLIDKVDQCGLRSGKEIDKFKEFGFTRVASAKVRSPMIQECPVNIECVVKDIVKLGAHDMFIGEVLAIHADTEAIDMDGHFDYARIQPFVYNQGEYWDLGKKIGFYGFSAK